MAQPRVIDEITRAVSLQLRARRNRFKTSMDFSPARTLRWLQNFPANVRPQQWRETRFRFDSAVLVSLLRSFPSPFPLSPFDV